MARNKLLIESIAQIRAEEGQGGNFIEEQFNQQAKEMQDVKFLENNGKWNIVDMRAINKEIAEKCYTQNVCILREADDQI